MQSVSARRALEVVLLSAAMASVGCEMGPAGPEGPEGPRGPAGERGPAGSDGAPGADGRDGIDGENGAVGADGTDGRDGEDGMDGAPGANGANGTDGEDGADGANGAAGLGDREAFVAHNGGGSTLVERTDGNFATDASIDAWGNEGVAITLERDLIQAGDKVAGDPGYLAFIHRGASAPDGRTLSSADRVLGGSGTTQTGLVKPKGVEIIHDQGLVLVANNGAARVSVFATTASGDAPPIAESALPGEPWDLVYDEIEDRLFVTLTDGTLAVFDGYLAGGMTGAARVVTPADGSGAKIATNLHGIDYEPISDRLVVTEVGTATAAISADFARDGAIYVFTHASTMEGNVAPSRIVRGDATLLGNPVDIVLDGTSAHVAEKANDRILVFANVFAADGDVAPGLATPFTKPESIALAPVDVDAGVSSASLYAVSNPATEGMTLSRFSPGLADAGETYSVGRSLENAAITSTGDAYVTYDDGLATNLAGGIEITHRLHLRAGGSASASRDRRIEGASTGLVSPKGIVVAESLGLALVAENNAATPAILGFALGSTGDIAPEISASLADIGRPWDLAYDESGDRLYVSLTSGEVAVYDDFSRTGGGAGPDRVFDVFSVDGARASVNLHGIAYDAATDALWLSDVGAASSAEDGQVFRIEGASFADDFAIATVHIAGPTTLLGNPVDLLFDGRYVYVAEKSNDALLRWDSADGISELGCGFGPCDLPAARDALFTKPESIVLIRPR